jgi:HK97 family phage major capsid protein
MALEIRRLEEKREKLIADARAELEKITDQTTAEEAKELEARHDAALAEYDTLGERVDRLRKLEERERAREEAEERSRSERRPSGQGSAPAGDGQAEVTAREAFRSILRAGGDIGELTADERSALQELRTQVAGTDNAGGYTVPQELADRIIVSMAAHGPMLDPNVVTVLNTSTGAKLVMPTVDDTANSAAIKAEGAQPADDNSGDVTFGKSELDAYLYSTPFVKVSRELFTDSDFSFEDILAQLLGERLARQANTQLSVGTGSNQPQGIASAAVGKIAASTSAITADEIIDLQHSVDPAYRRAPGIGFMLNDQTLAFVRKLKDGDGNYLWQMGDFRSGAPDRLLGAPVHVNQGLANRAANAKPIIFGDLKQYYARQVGRPVIGVLRERTWPNLSIAGFIRADGAIGDQKAIRSLRMAGS